MVFIRLFTDAGVRKFGKKKCLYLGLLCSFLATLSYDMFTSIYSLIVARILHGIGFGLSTTFADALVAFQFKDVEKALVILVLAVQWLWL